MTTRTLDLDDGITARYIYTDDAGTVIGFDVEPSPTAPPPPPEPLDAVGQLATLLTVNQVITVTEAATIAAVTEAQIVAEAQAWTL